MAPGEAAAVATLPIISQLWPTSMCMSGGKSPGSRRVRRMAIFWRAIGTAGPPSSLQQD